MSDTLDQAIATPSADSPQAAVKTLASDAYKPGENGSKSSAADQSKSDSSISNLFGALNFFDSSADKSGDASGAKSDDASGAKSGDESGAKSGKAPSEQAAAANKITEVKSADGTQVLGIGAITVEHQWDWSHPIDSALNKIADKFSEPQEKTEKYEKPPELPKDPVTEKAKLSAVADDKLKGDPEKLQEFKDNIDKVEHRQPPLSADERAALYAQETRLLEAKGDKLTTELDRQRLAEEIMQKSADPTDIRQGYHGTCQVSTVEARMYYRDPSQAAKLIADMSIDGQTTLADGKVLKLPADQLLPDNEASKLKPGCHTRDYSGQLFQVAAVNTFLLEHGYQGKDMSFYPAKVTDIDLGPGEVEYRQVKPSKSNPTGEQLVDVRDPEHPVELKMTQPGPPGVNGKDLPEVYGLLAHKPGDASPTLENTAGELKVKDGDGVIHVKSQNDLDRLIKDAKAQNKLPIFVAIDTNQQPFRDDAGKNAGGVGGSHAVLITDIHEDGPPKGTTVEIQNPWGEGKNHFGEKALPIDQLYNAMGFTNDIVMGNLSKQIKDACGTLGNDDEKIFNALENKTSEQIQKLSQYWSNHSSQSLETFLETEMKRHPEELKRALKSLKDAGVPLEHPELA